MTSELRVLNERLLEVIGAQPHVGFSAFAREGEVLFCNAAARRLFYGIESFDPVGMNVTQIEGDEFSAELLPLFERCCLTRQPLTIDHVRFGKRISSIGWPVRRTAMTPVDYADAVVAITVLARTDQSVASAGEFEQAESSIASWGLLERLTDRELEVLAEIGRGLSQRDIAAELGITRKTVETHRARIGQKLNAKSSTELARIACECGLRRRDVQLKRQRNQEWMAIAERLLAAEGDPSSRHPETSQAARDRNGAEAQHDLGS